MRKLVKKTLKSVLLDNDCECSYGEFNFELLHSQSCIYIHYNGETIGWIVKEWNRFYHDKCDLRLVFIKSFLKEPENAFYNWFDIFTGKDKKDNTEITLWKKSTTNYMY